MQRQTTLLSMHVAFDVHSRFTRCVVVAVVVRGVCVGVWGRFVSQEVVRVEGPNHGGTVATAVG